MGESSGTGWSSADGVILVPLHHRPELTGPCAELLNLTWRRSLGARIHSLQRSSDDFPVCLVLLGAPEGPVLGHARLSRVVNLPGGLFVESVVVGAELRGKGYGRRLMEAIERYARGRGFRNLYLSTHDKQNFYHHLGYRLTQPVQSVGMMGALVPPGMFQKMSPSKAEPKQQEGPSQNTTPPPSQTNQSLSRAVPHPPPTTPSCPTPVVPCAPPPPPFLTSALLSAPPPCPRSTPVLHPHPSCPPLPPPLPSSLLLPPGPPHPPSGSALQTPYQDFRGDPVFWMMKSI